MEGGASLAACGICSGPERRCHSAWLGRVGGFRLPAKGREQAEMCGDGFLYWGKFCVARLLCAVNHATCARRWALVIAGKEHRRFGMLWGEQGMWALGRRELAASLLLSPTADELRVLV